MNKKKLWLLIILTALLIGAGWLSRNKNLFKEKKEEAKEEQIEKEKIDQVDLVLDFGEGKLSTYSVSVCPTCTPTVLEILSQATQENNLNLKTKDFDFGILVEEIGETKNSQNHAWLYFVNNKMAEVAADKYELKKGDLVEWKYQEIKL